MKDKNPNILLITKDGDLNLPDKIEPFEFNITLWDSQKELNATYDTPDIILIKQEQPREEEDIIKIKTLWCQTPIFYIIKTITPKKIHKIFTTGCSGYIKEDTLPEDLLSVVYNLKLQNNSDDENTDLIKNFASLAAHLQEKNSLFETIFDILSHDTRNIFFYLHSLIPQVKERSTRQSIEDAVTDLDNSISEVTNYLKDEKRILSVVDILRSLRLTKKRIMLTAHPGIRLTTKSNNQLFVETSSLFKNALANIIENALKFSPDGSKVMVEVFRQGESILINIGDHGIGIPDENKQKVFQRHFRGKDSVNLDGSGRGLWITQNIIEKEKGKISIEDNTDGGTLFKVEIPAFKITDFKKAMNSLPEHFSLPPSMIDAKETSVRSLLQMETKIEDMDSLVYANLIQLLRNESKTKKEKLFYKKLTHLKTLNPGGKTVLIVDDSIFVHYYLATQFTQLGFKIVGYAENGVAGISFYDILKPDLVTLDFTMPIMSGTDAARGILEKHPEAKILFITGVGEHPEFIKKVKNNFNKENYKIITKPFKIEKLKTTIKKFI